MARDRPEMEPSWLIRTLAARGHPRRDQGFKGAGRCFAMAGTVNGIVAGYDGSPASQEALDWAVWEARARGLVLTVCHAWPSVPTAPLAAATDLAWQYGERVVTGGVRHAQGIMGAGDIRPLLAAGPPARVLCELSRTAGMVVLGNRGCGGLPGLLLGSVSAQVAAHGRGVVVVVRGHWRPVPGYAPRPVVVGADGSGPAQPAVAFAFAEAALRDVPLLAVCALADAPSVLGGGRLLEAAFEQALAKGEADYPEVVVRRQVLQGAPRSALLDAASAGQLLVVGARGRGGLRGMMLGSVCLALLHHAPCPVAVVHQQ
jgi:nucleotide-binding universal stress UspA family protein